MGVWRKLLLFAAWAEWKGRGIWEKNVLQISEMEITVQNMPLTTNYKSLSKSQVEAQSKSKVLKVQFEESGESIKKRKKEKEKLQKQPDEKGHCFLRGLLLLLTCPAYYNMSECRR